MNHPANTPFECIDARVGGQLWRLEDPNTAPAQRAEIEAHLEICHACRFVLQVDAAVHRVAQSGGMEPERAASRISPTRARFARAAWLARLPLAGLPLAACLAAILLLPPRPIHDGAASRGAEATRFRRPVEGEIVSSPRPALSWTPVAGASRYEIELRDHSGKPVWRGESVHPSIPTDDVPALPRGGEYRALLSVQPSDLLPPGRVSVAFKTGTLGQAILHRLRWAHPALQVASALAALGLVLVLSLGRRVGLRAAPVR